VIVCSSPSHAASGTSQTTTNISLPSVGEETDLEGNTEGD